MNKNTWMTVTLVGLIGLCATFVPWEKFSRPSTEAVKQQLKDRFEEYRALRLADDWVSIYDMVTPQERERVSRSQFLQFYGRGMMRTLEMELLDVGYTEQLATGGTKIRVKTKLVVENLPPQQRAALRVDDPEALLQDGEVQLDWSRHGGRWYFHIDRGVMTGNDGGREITPLDGGKSPPPGSPPANGK